jgi:hypothetical protein
MELALYPGHLSSGLADSASCTGGHAAVTLLHEGGDCWMPIKPLRLRAGLQAFTGPSGQGQRS